MPWKSGCPFLSITHSQCSTIDQGDAMPTFRAGKGLRVSVTQAGRKPVELGVPIQFDGEGLKTASIYVADLGRKVVFIEYFYDRNEGCPFSQGEVVKLDISHDGADPEYHLTGVLDIIGVDSSMKQAVRSFLVFVELPSLGDLNVMESQPFYDEHTDSAYQAGKDRDDR